MGFQIFSKPDLIITYFSCPVFPSHSSVAPQAFHPSFQKGKGKKKAHLFNLGNQN
jgi:hypothetical protein